ncbi:MAG: hypothetical protein EP339_14335 [Gammaproteobacteria bacterium]|nr:MAG: hypothetical protein EP339_14335 [Gammaproteobacteria bacterium]
MDFSEHRFFIEKPPDHLANLRNIQAVIPSARFIYLERDAAKVVESLMAAGRSWSHA